MENELRVAKAKEIKSQIDHTKPVTNWGFTANVWTRPDSQGGLVRVYVNDKKNKPAAIIHVGLDGEVTAEWQKGHSMTRDELRAALGVN
jgi:hypothetical protein